MFRDIFEENGTHVYGFLVEKESIKAAQFLKDFQLKFNENSGS